MVCFDWFPWKLIAPSWKVFLGGQFFSLSARNVRLSHAQYCFVEVNQSNNLFWFWWMELSSYFKERYILAVDFSRLSARNAHLSHAQYSFAKNSTNQMVGRNYFLELRQIVFRFLCTECSILNLSPVSIWVTYFLDCQSVWSKLKVTYCSNDRSSLLLFVYLFPSQFHDQIT